VGKTADRTFWDAYNRERKEIVKELGAGAALVWDCIVRYSKIPNLKGLGFCFASYQTMADETGLCRKTVRNHVKRLLLKQHIKEIDKAEGGQNLHRTRRLRHTFEGGNETPPDAIERVVTLSPEGGKPYHPNAAERVVNLTPEGGKPYHEGGKPYHQVLNKYLTNTKESLKEESRDDDESFQLEEGGTIDADSSSSLSQTLQTITGVGSSNTGLKAALNKLRKAGIDSDRLMQWFNDDSGWRATLPSNAERKQPWPSQVAQLVPVWKTKYEQDMSFIYDD